MKSQETWTTSGVPPHPPGLPKYQVWSSVLQTPLTELSNEGTKLKTKVLAGGAVIAEQVNGTGRVEWISADPVTGSSVRLHQSGVFYDDETKQLEPLGQEVLAVEPPVVEEPDPNEASAAVATHSAGEPEWQCRAAAAAGNNFWQQPVHCQQAQIQDLNFSLEGLLSAHTENNLNRLAQPLATVTIGTAINLRPTIKPDGSANASGSAVVPSTSQPDDGSEETTLLNSGGTAESAFVTVGISFGNSHGPSLDERFVGAESSGQTREKKRSGDEKIFDSAIDKVRLIIAGENDCAKFFKNKDVALKALNAFAAKATVGVIGSLTNKDTGIRQSSDKDNPITRHNAEGGIYDIKTKIPAAYLVYGIVTVNKYGNFFDKFKSIDKFGNYDNGETRSQLLQILHELAHVVLDEKGQPLIPEDGGNNPQSIINTQTVKTACQKEIEAAGKR